MDILHLMVLSLLGLVGGVLSGLIGVGGGVFFVPALMLVMGWDIKEAVAVSLVIIIFSALSGTIRNLRSEDPINWRITALLALTVAPSALIGVAISHVSSSTFVEVVFAIILLLLAYPTARGELNLGETQIKIPTILVLVAGIIIGALSGLVGVGGGVLMVPLMVLGLNLSTKPAVATSLAITIFTGIVGSIGYIATGFNQFSSIPPLVAGSVLGAWFGVHIRDYTPDKTLRTIFAIFMTIVAIRILTSL
jgi:uncharacterized membrane protein YfcA